MCIRDRLCHVEPPCPSDGPGVALLGVRAAHSVPPGVRLTTLRFPIHHLGEGRPDVQAFCGAVGNRPSAGTSGTRGWLRVSATGRVLVCSLQPEAVEHGARGAFVQHQIGGDPCAERTHHRRGS